MINKSSYQYVSYCDCIEPDVQTRWRCYRNVTWLHVFTHLMLVFVPMQTGQRSEVSYRASGLQIERFSVTKIRKCVCVTTALILEGLRLLLILKTF